VPEILVSFVFCARRKRRGFSPRAAARDSGRTRARIVGRSDPYFPHFSRNWTSKTSHPKSDKDYSQERINPRMSDLRLDV